MKIILTLLPEEYNLVYKGLGKLSIEEALPTLEKIIAQVRVQMLEKTTSEEKTEE